ncbi:bile acid:sodium symporter [Candidatus Accumulibacter sp. ACC003]|uniref:bile acid:sodium symporter n=1 Tax=Candidatus Accumulibacter sp. ACC003 TaxID=2823334 RepID=UPI0025C13F48|nr:bile acid:sodium symporter [Candidatus Accumulibacter sp. ACC003]
MIETLEKVGELAVVTYVVSSMLVMGMSQRLPDVVAPLQDPRTVVVALVVNFIAAPLLALLLARIVPLQPAHAIGLLLLGGAAGAPFIPKLAEVAGGDLAYSVAIMVLLMIGSIAFIPVVLPWVVPGLSADPWSIARPLLLMMLLPLALGFVLGGWWARASGRLLPFLRKLSSVAFMVLLVLLVGLNIGALVDTIGSFAIGTYGLFVLAVALLGYVLGGENPRTRNVLALASGERNTSAALVVAVESLNDPAVVVMVLIGAVVGLAIMLATARQMCRRLKKMNESQGDQGGS